MSGFSHTWQLTIPEARELQNQLAGKVLLTPFNVEPVSLVGAVDVSSRRGDDHIHAAVVVHDLSTGTTIDQATVSIPAPMPYVPGYLSFREVPAVLAAWECIENKPDAVLCDGQGIAHPRRLGLASHLGLWLNLPAVGVAKSRLIGSYAEPGEDRWSSEPLFDGNEQIGIVLRSRAGVKPLFISPGHLCDMDAAIALVKRTTGRFRLPEPSRAAHQLSNRARQTHYKATR